MNSNQMVNDQLALIGGIHGASRAAAAYLTNAIALADYERIMFVIDSGAMGTSATLDFNVQGSLTATGTYVDIPLTNITQFLVATDTGCYAIVEVRVPKIQDLNLGYTYIKGQLTVGTATDVGPSVQVWGVPRNYGVAGQTFNGTDVHQVLQL